MADSRVLIVEDDSSLREALEDTLKLAGLAVTTAADGHQALELLEHQCVNLVVSDIKMKGMDGRQLLKQLRKQHSHLPVILMTAFSTVQDAVAAMREGAVDYLAKPFEADALIAKVNQYILPQSVDAENPVANDAASKELLKLARRVAASEATVLVHGESGTGKEIIARFLHANSKRSAGPFVALNCAAIPDNMLEAILFGYEKGAFTGAYQATAGKFEQAQGGTLLLDEVSEMPLALQAKLLRVLQEREVERLGGKRLIDLDVRVLATTNRRLREEVAAGRFREDLFYRINVFPLSISPLRKRTADIPDLANRLLERHRGSAVAKPKITEAALAHLATHSWPGNVRELENVIQRALILSDGASIGLADLQFEPDEESASMERSAPLGAEKTGLGKSLKDKEFQVIVDTLEKTGGSRKEAASLLGISQRTLRYKLASMRESGVSVPA